MALVSAAIYQKFKRAMASFGFIIRTAATSVVANDPSISAGAGAPSAAEPNGSLYVRTDGAVGTTLYIRVSGGWVAVVGTDAEVAALAGLVSAADRLPYFTGSGTAALATFTAAGRALVDDADAAAQRATLSLVPGTDVQAYSAVLAALAAGSADQEVLATVAVGDATGGATGATCAVQLKRRDNTTNIASARQVMIKAGSTQYQPETPLQASVTFGTATVGSIIASGGGWALVETDATGAFACTCTNTDDETLYFAAYSPPAGGSNNAKACVVVGSNSDAAVWSA